MAHLTIHSPAEQVAQHLRAELLRGTWVTEMPGTPSLAEQLGVNRKTVTSALCLLQEEGILIAHGAGKPRTILSASNASAPMRIAHLLYEKSDTHVDYMNEFHHRLKTAGHIPFHTQGTLVDLKFNMPRIQQLAEDTDADAWIVASGSKEILEWFSQQSTPVFALYGRQEDISIAGVKTNKPEAYTAAARRLIELGHRRIVHLCRTERRTPHPGRTERAFLDELEVQGIMAGKYNLPDWEDTPEGFHAILQSLFQLTPPTALVVSEPFLFVAAQQFLAHQGIRVPAEVSLICTDNDPTFAWCEPSISHIAWDTAPVVRSIVRWADQVSRGREHLKQTRVKATFIEGGTVGPAPAS